MFGLILVFCAVSQVPSPASGLAQLCPPLALNSVLSCGPYLVTEKPQCRVSPLSMGVQPMVGIVTSACPPALRIWLTKLSASSVCDGP